MPTQYFYPTPIYFYDNEDLNLIDNEIKTAEKQIEPFFNANVWNDNVHSTFGMIKNVIGELHMVNFHDFLLKHACIYAEELNLNSDMILQCSWFNKLYKHGYQDRHSHGYNMISGCYYYGDSLEQESGLNCFMKNYFGKEQSVIHHFKPNKLILFPGLLEHSVSYKQTDGVRKSISFNFYLKD